MIKMVSKWFSIKNLKYTIPALLIFLYLIVSTWKWVTYKRKYEDLRIKIEYIKEPTIIVDSVQYETVKEIFEQSKSIVIHDTLVTDERVLYLLQKYK